MKFEQISKYSLKNLKHRRMRLWLTILGIVVGIASVVALLAIGEGINFTVDKELSSLGGDLIYIIPMTQSQIGSAFGPSLPPTAGKLWEKDVARLRKIPEITDISRITERRASLEYKGKGITALIDGVEPGIYEELTPIEIEDGRFLEDNDRRVVVIGRNMAEENFGSNNKIGVNNFLTINDIKFRVIGILAKSGSAFGTELDNAVLIHFEDSRDVFREQMSENEVDYIVMQVREESDLPDVVEKIEFELDASHRVKEFERDYAVMTSETIKESVGAVLSLITVFLGAVASISLVVGALSIASGMFSSVIERTHEIGILKSVGATDTHVLQIFLFEAGALGAIGGLIGTILGYLIVYAASFFGLPLIINPFIAIFGFAFAFLIGLASGYFPAKRASEMPPVEALRYE